MDGELFDTGWVFKWDLWLYKYILGSKQSLKIKWWRWVYISQFPELYIDNLWIWGIYNSIDAIYLLYFSSSIWYSLLVHISQIYISILIKTQEIATFISVNINFYHILIICSPYTLYWSSYLQHTFKLLALIYFPMFHTHKNLHAFLFSFFPKISLSCHLSVLFLHISGQFYSNQTISIKFFEKSGNISCTPNITLILREGLRHFGWCF